MNNAITIACELPAHLKPEAADEPVVSVFDSGKEKRYNVRPGQTLTFPLYLGRWLTVKKLTQAPCRIVNNLPAQVLLQQFTYDQDELDDVLGPRQSRALTHPGSETKITTEYKLPH